MVVNSNRLGIRCFSVSLALTDLWVINTSCLVITVALGVMVVIIILIIITIITEIKIII